MSVLASVAHADVLCVGRRRAAAILASLTNPSRHLGGRALIVITM
jgi:hypothetical protein